MLEREIEAKFCAKVKALGGMCEKFTSPGRRSVPDRLVILPGGQVVFVELKRSNQHPTPAQARDHQRRRDLGCDVRVISTEAQIDAFPR